MLCHIQVIMTLDATGRNLSYFIATQFQDFQNQYFPTDTE